MDNSQWHRIVHFDLKGAPPHMEYFINVLKKIKSWGATGVLLEWEDTFPYSNDLSCIGSIENSGGDDLYSMTDVMNIFKCCYELDLEVIQLVQTVGHMEYVLKKDQFKRLREMPDGCSDLCVSKPESKALVHELIRQVLAVQRDPKFLHIGADEVSCYGVCEDCRHKVTTFPQDNWRLYLQHLIDIVHFVKQTWPGVTVLVWDDMIRKMDSRVLKEYKLGETFQPVVWNYRRKEEFTFGDDMWNMYREVFPVVWAASAYKGANKPCSMVTESNQYISNHEAWRCERDKLLPNVNFIGIILTGWSRFDHYATLCELLPTSMDSLAKCLKSLTIPVETIQELYTKETLTESEWPGYELALFVSNLNVVCEVEYKNVCDYMVKTYMNQWQIANGFFNIQRVRLVESATTQLLNKLKYCESVAYQLLIKYTGHRSTEEWVKTNILPLITEVSKQQSTATVLLSPSQGKGLAHQ